MRSGSSWIGHSLRAAKGIENQFHPVRYAESVENTKQVVPHGAFAKVELEGDPLAPHIVETLRRILKRESTFDIPTPIISRLAKPRGNWFNPE
jgi:hypothetical protein